MTSEKNRELLTKTISCTSIVLFNMWNILTCSILLNSRDSLVQLGLSSSFTVGKIKLRYSTMRRVEMPGFTPRSHSLHPCSLPILSAVRTDPLLCLLPLQQTVSSVFSQGTYRLLWVCKQSGARLTKHKIPAPGLYFLADLKTQPRISDKGHF